MQHEKTIISILFQLFPGNLLAATQVDPDNPGHVICRTEVERRDVYMKKLESQFSASYPILVQLVSQCLNNDPLTRPSSDETLGRLQEMNKEIERKYGGITGRMLNIGSILAVKDIKSKDKIIKNLQVRMELACKLVQCLCQYHYLDLILVGSEL